jgi:hypothetical protein
MEQDEAVNKVFRILKSRNMVIPLLENEAKQLLIELYAIGHDAGRSYATNKRPINKCDEFGNKIAHYNSVKEAMAKTGTDHRNISRSATKNIKAGGYYWTYE